MSKWNNFLAFSWVVLLLAYSAIMFLDIDKGVRDTSNDALAGISVLLLLFAVVGAVFFSKPERFMSVRSVGVAIIFAVALHGAYGLALSTNTAERDGIFDDAMAYMYAVVPLVVAVITATVALTDSKTKWMTFWTEGSQITN